MAWQSRITDINHILADITLIDGLTEFVLTQRDSTGDMEALSTSESELLWLLLEAAPEQRTYLVTEARAATLTERRARLMRYRQSDRVRVPLTLIDRELTAIRQKLGAAESALIAWAKAWLSGDSAWLQHSPQHASDLAELLAGRLASEQRRELLVVLAEMR
jgi:hypothetical protein